MSASHVIAQLGAEQSELRRRYVELVVDQVFALPVRHVVNPQALQDIVQSHCEEPALAALMAQVAPIVERCRARISAGDELAGRWVATEVQAAVPRLVANPNGPRLRYLANIVDPALVRRLLAPVLQDVLMRFVARLPAVIGNVTGGSAPSDGGLLGRIGRDMGGRGKRLLDAGLSMVSGLGLEQKLEELAADFSQQAVGAFRESLAKRLQSAEGRSLVQTMVEQSLKALMQTPLSELNADLDRVPLSDVLDLIPTAVAHAATQQLFAELLHDEIHRYVDAHGDRSVADVLSELHVLEEARTAWLAATEQHAHQMFASSDFATWLGDLLVLHDQSPA